MAEDCSDIALGQLAPETLGVGRLGRLAEPLHVALHENLSAFAVDGAGTFNRFPGAAGGGHVGSELHF